MPRRMAGFPVLQPGRNDVPSGEYVLSSPVMIREDGIGARGALWNARAANNLTGKLVAGATVLRAAPGFKGPLIEVTAPAGALISSVDLAGFTFDCAGLDVVVLSQNPDHLTVRGCVFGGSGAEGIRSQYAGVDPPTAALVPGFVEVADCIFSSFTVAPVHMLWHTQSRVRDCYFNRVKSPQAVLLEHCNKVFWNNLVAEGILPIDVVKVTPPNPSCQGGNVFASPAW